MQPATPLSGLSPAQDVQRRIERSGRQLRKGQRKLIEYVSTHPDQTIYNGVLPTGYGKSLAAEAICDVLKQQGRANRFLFVVPTDTQREQYATGIARDVDLMSLNLKLLRQEASDGIVYHIPVVLSQTVADLRAHRENRCEVYITTIQSIHANRGWYSDFMASGVWCVFADEYQKLNREDGAKWGRALEALHYSVLFGLTATPVRTDRKQTVFASKEPDVSVAFKDAYMEQAIRRVVAHIEHYFVDVEMNDEIVRITTDNIEDYDLSRELRFTTKYYASLISSAYDCLMSKNLAQPGQHQMLIFAMSVKHAQSVCDVLNLLFGNGFSEWVGVGPDGRSTTENKRILEDYKANRFRCLVQVDIAGEGFDNPRSSVLVFLNLLRKASVKAIQQAGRGLRRNYGIATFSQDVCDMFASPDTEMADLIRELAEQTLDVDGIGKESNDGDDKDRATPLYDIPPFESMVKDAEYDRSEIISKIPQADVDLFRDAVHRREPGSEVSDDRLRAILADERIEQMKKAEAIQKRPEIMRDKVKDAQSILVGNALRLRYGDSVTKGAVGDMIRIIHAKWKSIAKMGHDEMLPEDFKRKHEWLTSINEEIKKTRELPRWLLL
jgi:superfamily II DNA or RNA helicase